MPLQGSRVKVFESTTRYPSVTSFGHFTFLVFEASGYQDSSLRKVTNGRVSGTGWNPFNGVVISPWVSSMGHPKTFNLLSWIRYTICESSKTHVLTVSGNVRKVVALVFLEYPRQNPPTRRVSPDLCRSDLLADTLVGSSLRLPL